MLDLMLKQTSKLARRLLVSGRVQGVGYRPFVYRLAQGLNLKGWVRNVTGRVEIHVEGGLDEVERLVSGLIQEAPAISRPQLERNEETALARLADFRILQSQGGEADIHVPPDYFTCEECLEEMNTPTDRRHRYPFINCTQCGPRYTLIESLPYDRQRTSMKSFKLCPACLSEYENPLNRRFHAEPVACPVCGPSLTFAAKQDPLVAGNEAALSAAVAALMSGRILAVKGVGGYHLMCDARRDDAVSRLRERKPRPSKPLAVLFPADGEALAQAVKLELKTEQVLRSPERPIVLLPMLRSCPLSLLIAPGLNDIGCMLPYSPLHALLLKEFGGPLVATSGNLSGEPVMTENDEAQDRLARVADGFLHHNRPILRPVDDSVHRIIARQPRPLRLGRGAAPLELELPRALPEPVLALGAHTKNAIALAWKNRVVISPHIGDLGSAKSLETLVRVAADLQQLYQVQARRLLLDRHPAYGYRRYARQSGVPMFEVWHHRAHAAALAWEFPSVQRWIVFAWDGVGLGEDGALWGGEAYVGSPGQWQRKASWRPFRLPGGEKAGREPWRSAAALSWETGQCASFAPDLLREAWGKGVNSPPTRAVGRLFDAAAALTGICTEASFEGEGPMKLEAAAEGFGQAQVTSLPLERVGEVWQTDWAPLLPMLTEATMTQAERAARFHASLAHALLDQAMQLRQDNGVCDVGFTGGVFQNRLLTEQVEVLLEKSGFQVHIPKQIPINDAGICLGQVMEFLSMQ
ncbi:MAG TPA: carbamoyltransferase HypF [Thiobacillaceae bacterium]|nr:carbamoyltransferase HypF [Thiobacillaceae bacterium]